MGAGGTLAGTRKIRNCFKEEVVFEQRSEQCTGMNWRPSWVGRTARAKAGKSVGVRKVEDGAAGGQWAGEGWEGKGTHSPHRGSRRDNCRGHAGVWTDSKCRECPPAHKQLVSSLHIGRPCPRPRDKAANRDSQILNKQLNNWARQHQLALRILVMRKRSGGQRGGFPHGSVVKNPPTNVGDTRLIPGPRGSHMPQNN